MKNFLFLSLLSATVAWGGPCTTAVGSTHVFATCTLGDRTFSAFATMPDVRNLAGSFGQSPGVQTEVLVPFAEWKQSSDRLRLAGSSDGRAVPPPSDHGWYIAGANRSDFDRPSPILPADVLNAIGLTADGVGVPSEADLVPLQTGEPATLVLTPDLGTRQEGQDTETPILSPEVIEPGGDFIKTPEPATYASIGAGLIGLWCLSRRAGRKPPAQGA